ncbi:hypothetical protein BDZ90DRAFT_269737 [Jaminaea rosea]|uniref:Uncharacterized protein n=1 Tax=Jaminaea rosea TaxID=1569628 RepID=A0A316UZT6_9BASI|nr:hypothetical protein BDZ90DRAFT_269737 [Jaminaea rosea]PWN29821.1 hypothetical protein BDZ90DRAFT_269737 [Jaminaea rosea]
MLEDTTCPSIFCPLTFLSTHVLPTWLSPTMVRLSLLLLPLLFATLCSGITFKLLSIGISLLSAATGYACERPLPLPDKYKGVPCLVALGIDLILAVGLIIAGVRPERGAPLEGEEGGAIKLDYGTLIDVHPAWHGGKEGLKDLFTSAKRSPSEHVLLAHHVGEKEGEISHWLYSFDVSTNQHRLAVGQGNYPTTDTGNGTGAAISSASLLSDRQDISQVNSAQQYVQYTWDDDDKDADHHANDDHDALSAAYYDAFKGPQYTKNFFNACMGLYVNGKLATGGALYATQGEHRINQPGQESGLAGECNDKIKGEKK